MPWARVRGGLGRALGLAALVLLSAPAEAAERVALVIGNSAYEHTDRLKNPGNDAAEMSKALKRLGFEVVGGTDLDRDGFYDKLGEFGEAARGADVTLFFYAGHGLQVDGKNWLVPVDAKLEKEHDLRRRAIELDEVTGSMHGTKKLVFLDACRDNPLVGMLARSMGLSRSAASEASKRGLARVESGSGMLIGYATAPGGVADDGAGENSPFTTALLEHIGTPGLSVQDMFSKVMESVKRATQKQEPWMHTSLGLFYLVPKDTAAPATSGTPPPSTGDAARLYYEAAERVGTVAAYQTVVEDFPGSPYAKLARTQIAKRKEEERARLASAVGAVFRDCPECPEMVVVPAGNFTMGSPPSEEGRYDDEGPVHPVTIPEPFAVGVYEVTRGEFARFVSATGRSMGDYCWMIESGEWEPRSDRGWRSPGFSQTDRDPVVCVSWGDAQAYVAWLSRKTGEDYRLLSEAEWEYAARARTTTRYHWGDDIGRNRANCYHHECGDSWEYTAPVGSFEANGFGLHDVHGNVREWVEDCWNESYAGAPSDGSAWESGDCGWRVLRGGSWYGLPGDLRATLRVGYVTGYRIYINGFRVARTLAR